MQTISAEQLKVFTAILADDINFATGNGNNRRVQPLGTRNVLIGTVPTHPLSRPIYSSVSASSPFIKKRNSAYLIFELYYLKSISGF